MQHVLCAVIGGRDKVWSGGEDIAKPVVHSLLARQRVMRRLVHPVVECMLTRSNDHEGKDENCGVPREAPHCDCAEDPDPVKREITRDVRGVRRVKTAELSIADVSPRVARRV